MKQEELNEVLLLHKMWLNNEKGGVNADLSGADLRGADLSCANLRGADLRRADLSDADLRGANIDFASLDFSCKTLTMITDYRIKIQYLYHSAKQGGDIADPDLLKLFNSKLFLKVVNKFHRVEECGKLEKRVK